MHTLKQTKNGTVKILQVRG